MKRLTDKTLIKNGITLIAPDEIFLQVPDYRKYYGSSYGRLLHEYKNYFKFVNPTNKDGYLVYTLSQPARTYKGRKVLNKNGKPKSKRTSITANRLVAMLFCENPYKNEYHYPIEYLDAHHKDHNRQNNHFKNIMWLSNGKVPETRQDHSFINKIKKIAIYNPQTTKYATYRDIERLCERINVNILELIDILKDQTTTRINDDCWTTYKVYDYYIGLQFYKNDDERNKTPKSKKKHNK